MGGGWGVGGGNNLKHLKQDKDTQTHTPKCETCGVNVAEGIDPR